MSERASEMAALVGRIPPTGLTTTTKTTDEIDASKFDSVLFVVQIGAVSSSTGKLVLTFYEGTSTGSVTTAITTKTINTVDASEEYVYDLDMENLSSVNNRYVKCKAVSSAKGFDFSVAALGFKPRFHPASDSDLASVQSITSIS